MESTYGDREHSCSHDDIERELERSVRRAVADGGHILVPAFAIGRTQTLLYHLNSLVEKGRIPKIAVAVDTPMGLKVTELYERSQNLFDRETLDQIARGDDPFDFRDLFAVRRGSDSVRLRDVKEPMIVIAGNGMCSGGRIVGHLRELLPREETCVLFVGFQAPGTPGHAIQRAKRGGGTVWLEGEEVAVRASIETLSGLSAHADRGELLRWLRAIPDVRRVALHHGEPEAQRGFLTGVDLPTPRSSSG
jgi:metallo-beta-lactamase family protein